MREAQCAALVDENAAEHFRSTARAETPETIRLSGGHAEKARTITNYREANYVDVEIRSSDGKDYRAHSLVLMAASDYFEAFLGGMWRLSNSGPHVLSAVPAD